MYLLLLFVINKKYTIEIIVHLLVIIQSVSKVGIQYIVNYCLPTVYLRLAHSVYNKKDARYMY